MNVQIVVDFSNLELFFCTIGRDAFVGGKVERVYTASEPTLRPLKNVEK